MKELCLSSSEQLFTTMRYQIQKGSFYGEDICSESFNVFVGMFAIGSMKVGWKSMRFISLAVSFQDLVVSVLHPSESEIHRILLV